MLSFLYILAASVIVTLVSLISAGFLYVSDERLKIWIPRLVAVAVGGLEEGDLAKVPNYSGMLGAQDVLCVLPLE